MPTEYFSMQGRVYIGPRNPDGSRGPARWVYDAGVLSWQQEVEKETKNESWTGIRGKAATLTTARNLNGTLRLEQLNTDNMALATQGVVVEIVAGAATAETIGDVQPGDVVALQFGVVTNLAMEDGVAAPLVEDTDYTINADTGVIQFLTARTGVEVTGYDYGAHSIVTALNGGVKDVYILCDGLNTVDGTDMKTLSEVHRVNISPAGEIGFIDESFGALELEWEALVDPVRQPDPQWGPYARVKMIGAD